MGPKLEIMAENIQDQIHSLQQNVSRLVRSYQQLKQENEKSKMLLQQAKERQAKQEELNQRLTQRLHILQTSAEKLQGEDRKEFEKTIDRYIKAVDQCLNLMNP